MEKLEESSDEITPTMWKESNEEGGQSYVVRKFIVFAAYLMQHTSLRKKDTIKRTCITPVRWMLYVWMFLIWKIKEKYSFGDMDIDSEITLQFFRKQ